MPIILGNGRYFGNLCALDPKPAMVADPRVLSMFARFAVLIGSQLDQHLVQEEEHAALLDERAAGELREQFIAILRHDLRNRLHSVLVTPDILERTLADRAHAELASRIKAGARRMSLLIDDVLDFARARWGEALALN